MSKKAKKIIEYTNDEANAITQTVELSFDLQEIENEIKNSGQDKKIKKQKLKELKKVQKDFNNAFKRKELLKRKRLKLENENSDNLKPDKTNIVREENLTNTILVSIPDETIELPKNAVEKKKLLKKIQINSKANLNDGDASSSDNLINNTKLMQKRIRDTIDKLDKNSVLKKEKDVYKLKVVEGDDAFKTQILNTIPIELFDKDNDNKGNLDVQTNNILHKSDNFKSDKEANKRSSTEQLRIVKGDESFRVKIHDIPTNKASKSDNLDLKNQNSNYTQPTPHVNKDIISKNNLNISKNIDNILKNYNSNNKILTTIEIKNKKTSKNKNNIKDYSYFDNNQMLLSLKSIIKKTMIELGLLYINLEDIDAALLDFKKIILSSMPVTISSCKFKLKKTRRGFNVVKVGGSHNLLKMLFSNDLYTYMTKKIDFYLNKENLAIKIFDGVAITKNGAIIEWWLRR